MKGLINGFDLHQKDNNFENIESKENNSNDVIDKNNYATYNQKYNIIDINKNEIQNDLNSF